MKVVSVAERSRKVLRTSLPCQSVARLYRLSSNRLVPPVPAIAPAFLDSLPIREASFENGRLLLVYCQKMKQLTNQEESLGCCIDGNLFRGCGYGRGQGR